MENRSLLNKSLSANSNIDPSTSKEVVLALDGGEVISSLALNGSGHCLEPGERSRVMHALFEEMELGLADAHLIVHFEHALTSIVKGIVANGLKC